MSDECQSVSKENIKEIIGVSSEPYIFLLLRFFDQLFCERS